MSRHYKQIAITQGVLALQALNGRWDHGAPVGRTDATLADRLGPSELAFLTDRHGFYVASAGATGWPHVQCRGGSPGSLRVLDNATLGWPDCAGNEQFVTTGNIAGDDWVAIIVMDDAGQLRSKASERARVQPARDVPSSVGGIASGVATSPPALASSPAAYAFGGATRSQLRRPSADRGCGPDK